MALLRALWRSLSMPAATEALVRSVPRVAAPLPLHPLRLLDLIGLRPFSAVAVAPQALARGAASSAGSWTPVSRSSSRTSCLDGRELASGPKCKPGEPILVNQPNARSVQGRKEKKRIKQRKAFIMVKEILKLVQKALKGECI